ncbi:hypothetical protein JVT61DRAFT_6866 [Boletus reticuloceps]|uniref:Uncharacterized protein n=1 Tax=Boletus reticuloceps TaxID=495285 RepID=A0A8I2YJG6_9AGAM|nr:hypothetical protein JVT61DRAFT_6866 [Boletus reticuloceps]
MSSIVLCLLITIIFSLPRVWGISSQVFNIVSNATCLEPDYAWMNNTEHQTPCLAVAYVIAACVGDSKSFRFRYLLETLKLLHKTGQLGHSLLYLLGTRMIRQMARRPHLVTGMTHLSSSISACRRVWCQQFLVLLQSHDGLYSLPEPGVRDRSQDVGALSATYVGVLMIVFQMALILSKLSIELQGRVSIRRAPPCLGSFADPANQSVPTGLRLGE